MLIFPNLPFQPISFLDFRHVYLTIYILASLRYPVGNSKSIFSKSNFEPHSGAWLASSYDVFEKLTKICFPQSTLFSLGKNYNWFTKLSLQYEWHPPLFVHCIVVHTHTPPAFLHVSRVRSFLMPLLNGWPTPAQCPPVPPYLISLFTILSMTAEVLCDLAYIYFPFLPPFSTHHRFCSVCMWTICFHLSMPYCVLALHPCICCSLYFLGLNPRLIQGSDFSGNIHYFQRTSQDSPRPGNNAPLIWPHGI